MRVGFHIVNFHLAAAQTDSLVPAFHTLFILLFDFVGKQLDFGLGLGIHKEVGLVLKLKFHFLAVVHHMKQKNLVLVVPQVCQRIEKGFQIRFHKQICKNHHQRPAMNGFGHQIYYGRYGRLRSRHWTLHQIFQLCHQLVHVARNRFGLALCKNGIGKGGEPHGIPLFAQHIHNGRRSQNAEG